MAYRVVMVAVVLVVGLMLGFAEGARADPGACPTRPADYTGTDATVAQLVALRQEAVDSCHAVADRLDRNHDDAHTDVGTLHTDLGTVDGRLHDGAYNVAATATAAQAQAHADAGTLAADLSSLGGTATAGNAAADAIGEGLHSDLWFFIGLGASLLAAYAIYRQVMPRA